MFTAPIARIRRASKLGAAAGLALGAALLAIGCAPKQSVPEGWPVKEAVPARPAKIISASQLPQGTWVMYFDSKQPFAAVAAGLGKSLAKAKYKELPQTGVAPDTVAGFISADGKIQIVLTNTRKLAAPGGKSPKSDYILAVTNLEPNIDMPHGPFPGAGMTGGPHGGAGAMPGAAPGASPHGGAGANPHGEGGASPPGGKGAGPKEGK